MSLYRDYFDEPLVNLNPSTNDSLNLQKYKHLKNKMENPFSNEHEKKEKAFYQKYLKILISKKNLNVFDKTLMYIIKNSLLDFKYNFDLIPLNHQENIIYYIFEITVGEGLYLFKTEKDY